MTHEWKPGDRGRIGFEYTAGAQWPVRFDGDKGASWLAPEALAAAEFVAPPMPSPGEWTGPGLTPIYEVRNGVDWVQVRGEALWETGHAVETARGRYFTTAAGFEWRRIEALS